MALSTNGSVHSQPFDQEGDEWEDQYYATSPYPLKRDLDAIINNIRTGRLDLTDSKALDVFNARWLPRLTPHYTPEPSNFRFPTALHLLADTLGRRTRAPSPGGCFSDTQLRVLVTSLVQHKSNPLAVVNEDSKTALHLAIDDGHETLAEYMCVAHPSINDIFSNPIQTEFCLHLAWRKKLAYFNTMVQMASAETLALQDKYGNSLLHVVVDYKRCTPGHLKLVQDVASRCTENNIHAPGGDFNHKGESPFLHHKTTAQQAVKEKGGTGKGGNGPELVDRAPAGGSVGSGSPSKATGLAASGNPGLNAGGGGTQTPPEGDWDFQATLEMGHQLGVTEQIASAMSENHHDESVYCMPAPEEPPLLDADKQPEGESFSASLRPEAPFSRGGGRPPPSPRLVGVQGTAPTNRPKVLVPDAKVAEQVEHFLKLYYLRNRSHDACLEIFYGKDTVQGQCAFYMSSIPHV